MGATTCILSCRTQKAVTATDQNSTLSYADTTKIVATYEGVGFIEFVKGGGKVSIDSAGNVTFEGVRNIKGRRKGSIAQDKGVAHEIKETAGHREQLNGVKADQTQHEKRTEEKAPAQKWYETALARLGLGVCIAALMWLLFLYIKRKF